MRERKKPEPPVTPETPPSGRDALLGALRSPSRAQIAVALLLFVVGFAAATQVRANEQDDDFSGLRQADLIGAFDGLAASTERAENEIDRLTAVKEELQDDTLSRQAALEAARQQEDVLNILAGVVPVQGTGIRITIDDPEGQVSANVLLDLIQELRASGAEAMEFNDRIRMVAQSSVEQTAAGIEINGELLEAPYILDAVGEPGALEGTLDFSDGPVERVEEVGGTLDSDQLDQVLVESVVEPAEPDFAEPQADR